MRALWARWARLVNRRAGLRLKFTPPAPVAISWNIGAACEMTAIPAVVLRNSSIQSAYHCQLRSAAASV